ncbi:MAG TPA: GntR family transcriptional regulator [Polyangiaceae bacterium]|nr:GntR family transcriptional regulator [Polyangiaceae bacterium]
MTNSGPFKPVTRSTIYEQVAAQISAKIMGGSLSSGTALPPERQLAQEFGVSRATVREALRHLQAQGLLAPRGRTSPLETATPESAVDNFRGALTRAVQLGDVSLADLLELRVAIETAALTRAAAGPVESHLAEARAALATMERPKVGWQEFFPADMAFHTALVAASGNPALLFVMLAAKDGIALHLDETMRARSFTRARERIVEEHRALLRAVERGNANAAARLVKQHVGEFYGS